jgi:hypothetical protein
MWRDAIADLNEQLHVEGIDEEEGGQKVVSSSQAYSSYPQTVYRTIEMLLFFRHFNILLVYILNIYKFFESWRHVMTV